MHEAILLLNGEGKGPINNMCVLSSVSPEYAPKGKHLIAISVIEPQEDREQSVREQLLEWFGEETKQWQLLRIDHISEAIPAQQQIETKPSRIRQGLYQCGDICGIASINTALESGSAAAKAFLQEHQ
jgi:predicted NAD/FAD-dependent oxidoreductase